MTINDRGEPDPQQTHHLNGGSLPSSLMQYYDDKSKPTTTANFKLKRSLIANSAISIAHLLAIVPDTSVPASHSCLMLPAIDDDKQKSKCIRQYSNGSRKRIEISLRCSSWMSQGQELAWSQGTKREESNRHLFRNNGLESIPAPAAITFELQIQFNKLYPSLFNFCTKIWSVNRFE